jgi:UDP-N-acetylmuramate dehydrogenase
VSIDALASALESAGLRVEREVPSRDLTTYRCGGVLRVLVRLRSLDEAIAAAAVLSVSPPASLLIVGRGSNLLVADNGFGGIAVVLDGAFEDLSFDTTAFRAQAGGAVPLPVLARRAAAAGIGGLEFYVGIPGSVGGAVRMNAGGHGRETVDVLVSARCVDLLSGEVTDRRRDDLDLGYRHSKVDAATLVCEGTFAGEPCPPEAGNARIAEIVQWRREHQPGGQNGGSVFTNPPGDSAGRLIDACGLKGLSVGGAVVSEKHANFFVARDGATAADVYRLIDLVRRRVREAAGVDLVPELQLVGFDEVHR